MTPTGPTGGSGGAACPDEPPVVTSPASGPVLGSQTTYELTFNEVVTLDRVSVPGLEPAPPEGAEGGAAGAGGTDSNQTAMGAGGVGGEGPRGTFRIEPPLPATGSSFVVILAEIERDEAFTIEVAAEDVADACGSSLEADFTAVLDNRCDEDTTPPTVTSPLRNDNPEGTTNAQYTLSFSEPVEMSEASFVYLEATPEALTVTPALPAAAADFALDLTLARGVGFRLEGVTDLCGNPLAEEPIVEVCAGTDTGERVLEYTGTIETYLAPPCTAGSITIEARGAQGGDNTAFSLHSAGLGAQIIGSFPLQTGEPLTVLVGQFPGNSDNGGGGGTFVVDAGGDPLVVAGGGGGSGGVTSGTGTSNCNSCKQGQAGTTGGRGSDGGGDGGTNGDGGEGG
ncbi:MAG: hypothetical protein AAGA56_22760, partial [Myxococcota bacterium]